MEVWQTELKEKYLAHLAIKIAKSRKIANSLESRTLKPEIKILVNQVNKL